MASPTPVARRQVRAEIQRRILSGQSQPGERLTQQSLARELGVAQGTVRESLLELEWLGLVESIDRLGVFVGKLDVSRLSEAYQVREFLEGLAVRLACDHASRADVQQLRHRAGEVWNLARQEHYEGMGAADRAFHLKIIDLSRNKILIRLTEGYRALGMAVRASRDPGIIHQEHLEIVRAIENNRADEAERLARAHVRAARINIEQQAARNEFTAQWVIDKAEYLKETDVEAERS